MIRVQLAGAADIAALLAADTPPRPDRAAGMEQEGAEQARPTPHRAERADDGPGRVRPVLGTVR